MSSDLGKLYTKTFIDGGGGSAIVDLNATYKRIFAVHTAGAAVDIHGSVDGSVYGEIDPITGPTSLTSAQSNVPVEIPTGLRYYKFIATTATGAGGTIKLFGTTSDR